MSTKKWLVVSTHLKNNNQIRNLPQIRVIFFNVWNHLEKMWRLWLSDPQMTLQITQPKVMVSPAGRVPRCPMPTIPGKVPDFWRFVEKKLGYFWILRGEIHWNSLKFIICNKGRSYNQNIATIGSEYPQDSSPSPTPTSFSRGWPTSGEGKEIQIELCAEKTTEAGRFNPGRAKRVQTATLKPWRT